MDLKTSNSNNNKNSIDNEKSAFEKFESEVKNAIFGVLFVLLKEEEMSIWVSLIISIIEFFQILIFPFHSQINSVWNSETIAEGIERFIEFFHLVYYFKNTNWNVYIIMFYVGLSIVVLVILDIFYVSYSFSKKKFAFVWPLHALRSLCSLFVTILFLPLLDYFMSVLGCIYDLNGNYVHHIFTEMVCWQGIYIVHAVLSIIISVVFVVISLTVSITYFECRSTSSDPTARVNARANFLFNFYEMVMIISFTFMNGDQYQYILLALILGGSTILFVKFHFNSPYYNEIIAKLWSALMSINLWTAMMLVFSKIMENTLFEGSIIAWMIGIPFIVLIVITNRDHRIDLLLINVNKFQNGQEIQNQIRYILKLISWQATNRNAAILLDGYIEIHKQTCNKDDCPLKQKAVKNNRLTKGLIGNEDNLSEKYALLIQLLYKMYLYGIKKFPNNTSLRISYSFFLLEKMHSKQQALQELSQAEQNKPPFDEQFIIYRYKKIIEDEIAESQNEGTGGLDVVSEIAFQNHLRQCQANIEKSALQHMEFWSQLSEDNPDLGKLNDIGSNINTSVAHVEEHWNKLLKINRNMPRAMRMYGKFLIEIINDKETGEELLDQARNMMNLNSNKKAINMVNMNNNDDFSNEATPTIFISGEQEKFAFITGINLAAASLFGYNKTELINRKVNVLMPQVYSKYHDSFIENYMNNNESKLANTNKEKLVFGKNKSNYIFPVYITIKAVPSILQGIQFIATFRIEKNFKNAAYVLTHPDGSIDSISSSCINLLKVDLKMIMQKKSNIADFVPNILKERQALFGNTTGNAKSFATVTFNFPKDSEYLIDNEAQAQLNCYLFDVVFLSGRENAGMQFRFEKVIDKNTTMMTGDRRAKIINFQFRYEKNMPKIIGEYVEGSSSDINSANVDHSEFDGEMANSALRSNLGDGELGASAFADAEASARKSPVAGQKALQQPDPEVKKVDYGAGIKTLRLVNGKATDILEIKDSEEAEEGEEGGEGSNLSSRSGAQQINKNKQEEEGGEEISQKEFNTTFKSRKALNQVINDKRPPASIRNLKWVANTLILVLVALAAIDYGITVREFNDIRDNLSLITLSNKKIAELQNIVGRCRDLYLLNLGISPNGTTEEELKSSIEASTNNVKAIVDTLQLNTLPLSAEHNALLQTNTIAMSLLVTGSQTSTTMFNLDQATLQVISRALNVMNSNLTSITESNTDLYFVTYNNFNDFYIGLRRSSELYVIELIDRTITKEEIFMVLLIISAVALIVALIVLFPVLRQVNKTREEVLSLFLDIPEKTVKGLYTKCENFISNLQVGEDDDMVSELEDDSFEKNNEEVEAADYQPRKKRKRFKNSGKSQRQFFLRFLFTACCIEAYFIADYFLSANLLNQVNSIVDEYNSTSVAESFYSFVNNAERQMMIDNKYPILKQDAQAVSVDNIKRMYYLDSEIHQEHSVNIQIHAQSYIDYFNHIMMNNPCDLLTSYVATNSCTNFADGAVFQGMAVDLTRHFENLRYLLILYVNNYNDPLLAFPDATVDYTTVYTPANFGNNQQKNNWLNILKTTQAVEVDNTQTIYIQNTFRLLMAQFEAGMNSIFDKYITNRIILFVFFYVVLLGAYLVLWLPLVSKLNKDIWRTKSMLTMIPLNVVAKIKSVKAFLKKFWNERNIANY